MMPETLPTPFGQMDQTDLVTHALARGETLFGQGESAKGLFYLSKGTIDLSRTSEGGHSIQIYRARAGDTFAEASLFSAQYHCTATAIRESQVVECRRESIEKLMATDIDFTRLLVSRFANQIQDGRRRIELLSIRAADERVLAAIADGLLVEDISSFSDSIGLAAETVYRSLASLTQEKRIRKTARGKYELQTQGQEKQV